MRNAAFWWFKHDYVSFVADVGLLTDELEDPLTGASAGVLGLVCSGVCDPADERMLPESRNVVDTRGSYEGLQRVRGYSTQALGALAAYDTAPGDTAAAKILRSELYSVIGYTELLLADLYCSGVPLSTLIFQGNYVYAPSSTTDQVYQAADFKFDTAFTLGRGNDSVRYLAQVLKGRAKLALALSPADYAAAADDVTTVPDAFQYQMTVPFVGGFVSGSVNINVDINPVNAAGQVSDHEGRNGLLYRSSLDPRTSTVAAGVASQTSASLYLPTKYAVGLSSPYYAPFTLASGIEARLIQAEAQLQPASAPSGPWLATLNHLRQTAPIPGTTAANPTALPLLSDPGAGLSGEAAATARIKLLFQERAFWLFLDGHRQGDLRRLLRQYGGQQRITAFRTEDQVYPTGAYFGPGVGQYGFDVTLPIEPEEFVNPLFHGCLDRNP